MSSEIPTETKEKSIEMRMRRWVKDDLDVEAVYVPFARQILEDLRLDWIRYALKNSIDL